MDCIVSGEQLAPGVFQDEYGLRAFKRTKLNGLETQRFKFDELEQAKRWREEVAARAVLKLPPAAKAKKPAGPTLADDAVRYLDAVQGMPTFADRKRHIDAWVAVLGTEARTHITSLDVRRCLETWRKAGTLSDATLNLRRTALMQLYRVLDEEDPDARNPVERVRRYPEPEAAALIHTPAQIRTVLRKIPDSRYKRILTVAAWTGWPYKQILGLAQPDLSRLKEGLARVTPRRKGGGTEGRWLPVVPQAVAALKALQIPGDLQRFHRRVAWNIWRRGCLAAKVEPCRPYDLRHAFGTRIASVTADTRAVSELMMHSTLEQALRYTKAAGSIRAKAAIRQLGGRKVTSNSKGRKSGQSAPVHSAKRSRRTEGKRKK